MSFDLRQIEVSSKMQNNVSVSGTWEEYRNYSWTIDLGYYWYNRFLTFLVGPLSILANSLVIYLSFTSKELKNHFKYLIANTAFLAACFSMAELALAIYFELSSLFNIPINIFKCTIYFTFVIGFLGGLQCTYSQTILCRHREIVSNEKCSKTQLLLQLLFPYTPVLLQIVSVVFSENYRAVAAGNCIVLQPSNALVAILPITVCILSLLLQVILSYRLYQFLKHHFINVTANLDTNRTAQERLMEERSILRAVLIQGVSPVVIGLPLLTRAPFVLLGFRKIDKQLLKNGPWLGEIAVALQQLSPLVDAFSVLCVVKSYKRAKVLLWTDMKNKFRA